MQLKIHEHLQRGQERSIRTFEHFLGHFFSKHMLIADWKMEAWLIEDEKGLSSHSSNISKPKFSCGIILSRPKCKNILTEKVSSNLSGAIFYAIKSIHREVLKDIQMQKENNQEETRAQNAK